MAAAMAEARQLDTLLDELLAWDSGDRDALRPSEPAQTMPVAVPTPPASRKRRRAGDADSKQWQEEALRLWESRTKTIAKKGEPPVPRLPSWQRRKLELKEAREEVERLEEKLRRLHGDTEMKTEDTSVKQEASNEVDWKQVAELEKKKKEESEIENARLRGLIKKQHELADVLAPAISLAKTCQSVTVPRDSQEEALSGRTELFASMELRLNKKLAQVRGKVRRIRDNAPDGQESCIVLDEASRPTVRVRRIKSMPFAVPVVMNIIRVYPHGGLLTGLALAIETQSISEDAVGLDFHMQVPPHAIGGSGFGVRTRGVMKRWSGEGREIFQFAAAREWMDAGSNLIAETSEYGWGYVREGVRRRQQGESTWMMATSDSTLVSLHIDKVGMDSSTFMNQVLLPACKYLDERLSQALENSLLDSLTTLK